MHSGLEWEIYQKCEFVEFIKYLWILDFKLDIFVILVPYHIHITSIVVNLPLKIYILLLF